MRPIALFALLSLSTSSFAWFCPSNFNQINIGDTIQQVEQQCGKPDGIKKSQAEDNSGPQEWSYFVQPAMNNYAGMRMKSTDNASVKMGIALNGGKVVNVTTNGMSLASTTICGGHRISVGDTADSVKKACGAPQFVDKSSVNANAPKPTEIILYKYNSTPPVVLVFENGKLQQRQ